MELSERLSVSPSARELNALRKIERDRLAEREGTLIAPGWASDIDRTMKEKWRGIDRPVGVAVYVLRDLIEQERAGDLDMSEPPDWIPRPPTEEELAERQASHEDAMARLIRMQQEHTEQEERAKREKQEAEAAAETERIERERQKAEVAAETERIERERREAEIERIRQAQVRQLAERLERAPERRSKLARYFGAEESDVAAWESALDLMLQDLELSEVLRHPGLIEVFEAMGLGLEVGGAYRLAFASNLKQQALLRPPGSEIVRTVVIEVLAADRNRCRVRPSGHSQPAGLGAQPRPGSMTMAGQNEQVSAVCPKCTANLIGGRDLPGCWRCGWEDYSQLGTGLTPLIGSLLSELASRGQRQRYGRPSPSRRTK